METFFQLLPDEINLEILNKLPYFDTTKLRKIPGLFHLLFDWSYWKQKCISEFGVPGWYFDLPIEQKREVSASQRYLEISSKFCLTSDSVVEEEGTISKENALFLAEEQGNENLIEFLRGDSRKMSNARFNSTSKTYGMQGPYFYHFPREHLKKMFLVIEEILQKIKQENFLSLIGEVSKNEVETMTALIISDKQEASKLIDEFFPFFNPTTKLSILIIFIGLGRNEKFKQLYEMSNLYIGGDLILYRATYYAANQELISFFEKKGFIVSAPEKLYSLADGYLTNPKPVEVYQILKSIGIFTTEYYTLKSFKFDVDISILQVEGNLDKMKKYVSDDEYSIGAVKHFLSILRKEDQFSFRELQLNETDPIKLKLFEKVEKFRQKS